MPSSHSPVPAICASSFPLSPISEVAEVQKGMTVLPVKSLPFTKLLTGKIVALQLEETPAAEKP